MMNNRKYPIGIQTFSEIIREGYLYVDKTGIAHHLVNKLKYVFLSRPRRFGKSLLMSTLEAYFNGEKELFEGLRMSALEKEWAAYPVLRFDMSADNMVDTARVIDLIGRQLNRFEHQFGVSSTSSTIAGRFSDLIHEVARITGKKVVILIDEYDKPMLDCLNDSETHESVKAELRGFYSVIKESDRHIKFAMLTGITKFGKVSVFSGLNNLKDISLLPEYNAICGISESEFREYFKPGIEVFAETHSITEDEAWKAFKTKYDGYHFASKGEDIYNPFSVLNAFDDNELSSYWFESGNPNYIVNLIERHPYNLSDIEGARRSGMSLRDVSDTRYDIVPFLFQAGYLTIKRYDPEFEEYELGFPNQEVRDAFWKSLFRRFFSAGFGNPSVSLRECVDALQHGDADSFMRILQSLFADVDSTHEMKKEIHFQNMMAIVTKMLGFAVRSEVHSCNGRCDMQILTPEYIYIFEFKINGSASEALHQILERGYHIPYASDGRAKILIGANFLTRTRTIDSWEIAKG